MKIRLEKGTSEGVVFIFGITARGKGRLVITHNLQELRKVLEWEGISGSGQDEILWKWFRQPKDVSNEAHVIKGKIIPVIL